MFPNGSSPPITLQKLQAAAPIVPATHGRNIGGPTLPTQGSEWCTSRHQRCRPQSRRLLMRRPHLPRRTGQHATIAPEKRNRNRRRKQTSQRLQLRLPLQNRTTPRRRRVSRIRTHRALRPRRNQTSHPALPRTRRRSQMTPALHPRPHLQLRSHRNRRIPNEILIRR
jgi:hypothetical protein